MDQSLLVLELKEWLEKKLERPHALTIKVVAEKAGYSKWHLQRLFRYVTSENLGVYILDRRLNMASVVLCRSKLSIIEISMQYGFDSQQSFTRVFRRKFNCSSGRSGKIHKESLSLPANYGQER